jgi:hypothetical protein
VVAQVLAGTDVGLPPLLAVHSLTRKLTLAVVYHIPDPVLTHYQ